ncbi:MAG: Calx-beta domain-containing protein, partial [Gaiellaceae bacterium]
MRRPPFRFVRYGIALVGVVVVGLGVSASAASLPGLSPSSSGRKPLFATNTNVSTSLSDLALAKSSKLSPRLLQLSKTPLSTASFKTQAAVVGLPSFGPGSLLRIDNGKKLLVYVRVSGSVSSASNAIESTGATIVNSSGRYGVVTASVDPSRLQALAKLPQVDAAFEALAPMRAGETVSMSSQAPSSSERGVAVSGDVSMTTKASCNPVVSEGDHALAADSARSAYGVNGSGVKVGIISDSYNALGGAAPGVANGELPGTGNPCGYTTPVKVLADDLSTGTDEGRAMLEIVHDLAPAASLAFATDTGGLFQTATNILALRDAGAKVIADDVMFPEEPFFQEGPISLAIDDVTASGVSYFSSAGNENVIVGGHNVSSYETPAYRPTTCPFTSPYGLDCHNFNAGSGAANSSADYTLANGGSLSIDLQWAEPWNGVNTDLDLFLFDADTGILLAHSADDNTGANGTQVPVEDLSYENQTGAPESVEVVICRYSGTAHPRFKYVLISSPYDDVTDAEYSSSSGGDVVGPTIFGHNGGTNTISTAAVPYDDLTTPEPYSSRGPVTYYYGPADGGSSVAPALSTPHVISAPSIAAVDCAKTSFFGDWDGSAWRFCGTSEAAPHAAAVAALMLNRLSSLTPAQVRTRLESTAQTVTNGGTSDAVGSGLINAYDAVSFSTVSFSTASYSVSEGAGSAIITIKRSGTTTGSNSVVFKTANGTATAGSDYTAVSQTVSFAAGVTSKTVSIPITNDTLVEGNETVKLSLSSPSSGAVLGTQKTATLTILDNDRAFAFSAASYSVNESGGHAT